MKKRALVTILSVILLMGCGQTSQAPVSNVTDVASMEVAVSHGPQGVEEASAEETVESQSGVAEGLPEELVIEDSVIDGVRTVRVDDVTAQYDEGYECWVVNKEDPTSLAKVWPYISAVYYAKGWYPTIYSADHGTHITVNEDGATEYYFNAEIAISQPVASPWWQVPIANPDDFKIISRDCNTFNETVVVDLYPDAPHGKLSNISKSDVLYTTRENVKGLYVLYPDAIFLYRNGSLIQRWEADLCKGCFMETIVQYFPMVYDGNDKIYNLAEDGQARIAFDNVVDANLVPMIYGDGIGVLEIQDGVLTLYHLNELHPHIADAREITKDVIDAQLIGDVSILLEKSDGIYLAELNLTVEPGDKYEFPDFSDEAVAIDMDYLGIKSIDYYANKFDEFIYRGDFADSFVDYCKQ